MWLKGAQSPNGLRLCLREGENYIKPNDPGFALTPALVLIKRCSRAHCDGPADGYDCIGCNIISMNQWP